MTDRSSTEHDQDTGHIESNQAFQPLVSTNVVRGQIVSTIDWENQRSFKPKEFEDSIKQALSEIKAENNGTTQGASIIMQAEYVKSIGALSFRKLWNSRSDLMGLTNFIIVSDINQPLVNNLLEVSFFKPLGVRPIIVHSIDEARKTILNQREA